MSFVLASCRPVFEGVNVPRLRYHCFSNVLHDSVWSVWAIPFRESTNCMTMIIIITIRNAQHTSPHLRWSISDMFMLHINIKVNDVRSGEDGVPVRITLSRGGRK